MRGRGDQQKGSKRQRNLKILREFTAVDPWLGCNRRVANRSQNGASGRIPSSLPAISNSGRVYEVIVCCHRIQGRRNIRIPNRNSIPPWVKFVPIELVLADEGVRVRV